MKRKIINALLHGAHKEETILRNQNLYGKAHQLHKALAELEADGYIEFHNRNLAGEYGYFITDKGFFELV